MRCSAICILSFGGNFAKISSGASAAVDMHGRGDCDASGLGLRPPGPPSRGHKHCSPTGVGNRVAGHSFPHNALPLTSPAILQHCLHPKGLLPPTVILCQLHRHCHTHNTGCCSTAPFILYPYARRVEQNQPSRVAGCVRLRLCADRLAMLCLARQTLHACCRPSPRSRCAQNSFRGLICDQGSRLMIAMLNRGRQHSSGFVVGARCNLVHAGAWPLQCSCMAGTRVCTFAITTRQCLCPMGIASAGPN